MVTILAMQVSLRFKGLSVFYSILLVSCVMWSGVLCSSNGLLSYLITSLAQHITTILISTLS